MNGIPLGVNQSVMLRYRFESAWLARCGFNDDDRKSLGSQKSILDLLFLIVITLGYRAPLGGVGAAVGIHAGSTAMGIWEHGRGFSRGVPSVQAISRGFQPLVDARRGVVPLSLTAYPTAYS
jgi:hypothetical protein